MNRKKWEKDKEYIEHVGDLLRKKEIQQLREYNHHYYNDRLNHSIGVSYHSYRIAKKLGANEKAVARAGLLHDLYYYDRKTSKEVLNGRSHSKSHPEIAVANAKQLTSLSDLEADIIVKHMWGATKKRPKFKEGYIVTLVDKCCAVGDLMLPIRHKYKKIIHKYKGHRKYHHLHG